MLLSMKTQNAICPKIEEKCEREGKVGLQPKKKKQLKKQIMKRRKVCLENSIHTGHILGKRSS